MATHSSVLAWKNPMDRGTWRAIDRGVGKSQTRLSTHTHQSSYTVSIKAGMRVQLYFPMATTITKRQLHVVEDVFVN